MPGAGGAQSGHAGVQDGSFAGVIGKSTLAIVECPRDAFQGLPQFIPTERKVAHLKNIISAGVAEIDFGSFVSPKAVPQMADTEDVLKRLRDDVHTLPRLVAIIANERG